MAKTTQNVVALVRSGQDISFGEGNASGRVKSIKALITMEDGSEVVTELHRSVEIVTPDEHLCPNGQDEIECREIDPCEMCQQDQDAEGDMIEISMGLRAP